MMKHRNKTKIKQLKAIFLLSLFVFESFWPTAAFALTESYQQPEFASYEEFGSTDMVNIPTGDFTYSLPLVNVPSPEGGFQMPLSYHAGIQMDEESSWVGLGWGLNPGVLNRRATIYPDDYDGSQTITNYLNAPSNSSYGWVQNFLGGTDSYDSNKGASSTMGIGHILSFTQSSATGVGFSVLGNSYNQKDGYKFDPVEAVAGGVELGMMLISFGALGVEGMLFSTGVGIMNGVIAISAASNQSRSPSDNYVKTLRQETEAYKFSLIGRGIKYNTFLRGATTNIAQGCLYLGNSDQAINPFPIPPTASSQLVFNGANYGSASTASRPNVIGTVDGTQHDMFVYYEDKPFTDQFNPVSTAYDHFSVNAGGISGAITPFRLDAGSFANPINSGTTYRHFAYSLTSFMPNKTNLFPSGYKVPFRYAGETSNSYTYPIAFSGNTPLAGFATNWDNQSSNYFQVRLNNPAVYNEAVVGGSAKVGKEANRADYSLFGDKLMHGSHIDWFSNHEIINNQAKFFMDCGINRSTFPVNGIGGFAITREDGMTYHFSVPVYNKTEYKKVKK
jgi:hypothetical protein